MRERVQKIFRKYRENTKEWFAVHGAKLFLFLGVLSAIAIAFEGGFLVGRDQKADPIILTTPAELCVPAIADAGEKGVSDAGKTSPIENQAQKPPTSAAASPSQGVAQQENIACVFVGSRNSDKYHLPKCSWAKRIKPENRVCFSSASDAESKGYKAGCVK